VTTRWTEHVACRLTYLVGKTEDLDINGSIILKGSYIVIREGLSWMDLCRVRTVGGLF